jgi:hypothetical protein
VAGLDALRKTYHDLKKAARKEGVSFEEWCKPHEQGTFLPDESTAAGPGEDAEDASESEDSDDDDQMPEPVSPITAPSSKRQTGTHTLQNCVMRAGVARVKKGPENKPVEKGEKPISPGSRAGQIGKKVIVRSEESEKVSLQVKRGKGRPETAGKPLPFTAMLGLKNPKTRSDCDPGLEGKMRLLGCLDEEKEQQPWDDLPTNEDEPEAPFFLGLGPQGTKPEDKLQTLLQEKVEKEKEKEKESAPKGEGSGKEIQWHEGLAQREATLAEVTAGGNVVNPQAQPFGANDEEKGEEVASPSMRVRATDQDMVDALLESPRKRKEEAPAPLVQDGGRKEAKKSKNPETQRRSARRRDGRSKQSGQRRLRRRRNGRSEQESSPAVVSEHAPKEVAGPEEGRAMEIDEMEKERVSGQHEGQKPAGISAPPSIRTNQAETPSSARPKPPSEI